MLHELETYADPCTGRQSNNTSQDGRYELVLQFQYKPRKYILLTVVQIRCDGGVASTVGRNISIKQHGALSPDSGILTSLRNLPMCCIISRTERANVCNWRMGKDFVQNCGRKRTSPKSETQVHPRKCIYNGGLSGIDTLQQVYRRTAFPANIIPQAWTSGCLGCNCPKLWLPVLTQCC